VSKLPNFLRPAPLLLLSIDPAAFKTSYWHRHYPFTLTNSFIFNWRRDFSISKAVLFLNLQDVPPLLYSVCSTRRLHYAPYFQTPTDLCVYYIQSAHHLGSTTALDLYLQLWIHPIFWALNQRHYLLFFSWTFELPRAVDTPVLGLMFLHGPLCSV